MKNKTKIKIGISLLIALFFIFPSGSIMAEGSTEAGVKRAITIDDGDLIARLPGDGPISQQCVILPNGLFDPEFGPLYGDIPEGTYDLWTSLFVPEDCGPLCVKVFLECYVKCCGNQEEIIMYETSFEDNFDIYNNWIQIDADCGIEGGQYDSWTHSDARASDGDYSFKCSMYDIYKGNQDDYLQCTKSFDISDQAGINVSFDIFVDGSGEELGWAMGGNRLYTVYDYFDFEVSDHIAAALDMWWNPDNWFNGLAMEYPPAAYHDDDMIFVGSAEDSLYEGAYKFFDTRIDPYDNSPYEDYTPKVKSIGGGWWHVWWDITTQELIDFGFDVTDMMFRFSWHSDPENQFEGAYVDNFKIVSKEACEEKVFQTHTQGPICVDVIPEDHIIYVDFPLDWDAVDLGLCKSTCYDFKLWLEVVEGDYINDFDWPNVIDIPVCVGDFYDCGILDVEVETSFGGETIIPGPGIVEQGEDLHVTTWVHLQGTVPAYDVPVKFTAYKKEWNELYFNDFEGSFVWSTGHFGDAPSLWHQTDFDSYSGSKAMACFNEDTKHYENDMYVDYAEAGPTFDVSEYLELEVRYYTKFITEGANDYWAFMIVDNVANYVLGNIGAVGFPTNGYQPTWIGPNQPQGKYQDFDLMAGYDYWHDVRGFFRNGDGTDAYDIGFGFAMWGTDADTYTNAQAEADGIYWSGLLFDDVGVYGLEIGAEVYSDVIIIPEMEPCEIYEVQFEWEDLPYSNYLLRVECEPEGGCGNWEWKVPWEAQILVVSNKESMHPKEVESIDLTGWGEGEWVISSSDYDNYIATQNGVRYGAYMDQVLLLAPDHGDDCGTEPGDAGCIDISQQIADGVPVTMDFDLWWDLEGYPWDYCDIEMAFTCPAELITDWILIDSLDMYAYSSYQIEPDDGWVRYSTIAGGPLDLAFLCGFFGSTEFALRFRFVSDSGFNFRGVKLDDIIITNLLETGFPPVYEDFEDTGDDLSNWCTYNMHTGQYWFHKFDRTGLPDDIGTWCNFNDENMDGDFTGESYVNDLNDALIWTTEIEDAYQAFLAIEVNYNLEEDYDFGYVEIDDGSDTWWILDVFTGDSGGWITEQYDISFLAGNPIQVRFRMTSDGSFVEPDGHYCVRGVHITGKQDHTAPMSTVTMTGTMKDSGWYNTAVKVKITATDNVAMGEIHYILDGAETVVAGSIAEFTVSGNGQHTLEFWAVDSLGNVEAHHIIPPFRIDSGSAPTVAITAPEPGLYLFGNKILSASKVIIIGAFTIEATASDAESGIYKVQFYLDGDVIAEDTELPFSAYCAVKHMGAGTIKVVAEDFAQNTAEDTLDITYYKFL